MLSCFWDTTLPAPYGEGLINRQSSSLGHSGVAILPDSPPHHCFIYHSPTEHIYSSSQGRGPSFIQIIRSAGRLALVGTIKPSRRHMCRVSQRNWQMSWMLQTLLGTWRPCKAWSSTWTTTYKSCGWSASWVGQSNSSGYSVLEVQKPFKTLSEPMQLGATDLPWQDGVTYQSFHHSPSEFQASGLLDQPQVACPPKMLKTQNPPIYPSHIWTLSVSHSTLGWWQAARLPGVH